MKIRAIKDFNDLKRGKFVTAGEEYEVSEARAKELSGCDNKAKQALVEIIEEQPKPAKKTTKKKTEV